MWLIYLLQTLFTLALTGGFYLWWMLDHTGHGYPPQHPGLLQWWHGLGGQPEFDLLMVQVLHPLLWWLGRKLPWHPFWRWWSMVHLAAVLLLMLVVALLYLATPDLGGHWG